MNKPECDPGCIFCKIIERKIPANIVSEGEAYLAIADISPQAPEHVLIMPKTHVRCLSEVNDTELLGSLMQATVLVADATGLSSYRLVVNTGSEAGQTVDHLHIHLLGGRKMHWPPG